jgi:hypothetical protein
MKRTIFLDVTLCNVIANYISFEGLLNVSVFRVGQSAKEASSNQTT